VHIFYNELSFYYITKKVAYFLTHHNVLDVKAK